MAIEEGPWPEEYIVGADGRWLGGFQSEYPVPLDTDGHYESLLYPTGWTNCAWYEMRGCWRERTCVCCGVPNLICEPRVPLQELSCAARNYYLAGGNDPFKYSIAPQTCNSGICQLVGSGTSPCVCRYTGGCAEGSAGWPLVGFMVANPSLVIRKVTDATGPPDLEDLPAMEIDFAGVGEAGATFVGEDGGCDTRRCGFDSNTLDDGGNVRSATAFTAERDKTYYFSAWVKAVPDMNGYTCSGWPFVARIGGGFYGGGDKTIGITAGNYTFILSAEWQQLFGSFIYTGTQRIVPSAFIRLLTPHSEPMVDECAPEAGFWYPKGRVHVKAVHLGTPAGGLHIWQRH